MLTKQDDNQTPPALEEIWGQVFELVNTFLNAHNKFGFELVAKKSNPSLADLQLSLRVMNTILDYVLTAEEDEYGQDRMMLNAKQQIVWFEMAVNYLKTGDKVEYEKVIACLKSQAQI